MNKDILMAACFMIATVCFSISFGYDYAMEQITDTVEYCASKVPDKDMTSFYKHEWGGDPRTFYPHAEAFTEYNWAKCFRKKVYKL